VTSVCVDLIACERPLLVASRLRIAARLRGLIRRFESRDEAREVRDHARDHTTAAFSGRHGSGDPLD
jgi:hypothetical protein